jgi:hypothetical protein
MVLPSGMLIVVRFQRSTVFRVIYGGGHTRTLYVPTGHEVRIMVGKLKAFIEKRVARISKASTVRSWLTGVFRASVLACTMICSIALWSSKNVRRCSLTNLMAAARLGSLLAAATALVS